MTPSTLAAIISVFVISSIISIGIFKFQKRKRNSTRQQQRWQKQSNLNLSTKKNDQSISYFSSNLFLPILSSPSPLPFKKTKTLNLNRSRSKSYSSTITTITPLSPITIFTTIEETVTTRHLTNTDRQTSSICVKDEEIRLVETNVGLGLEKLDEILDSLNEKIELKRLLKSREMDENENENEIHEGMIDRIKDRDFKERSETFDIESWRMKTFLEFEK